VAKTKTKWGKIAQEKVDIRQINKDGVNRHRRECFKIALYLNRNFSERKDYPLRVLEEYLRQLVGPEILEEIKTVMVSAPNYERELTALARTKCFVINGEFQDE
jgi:hypothetical protein